MSNPTSNSAKKRPWSAASTATESGLKKTRSDASESLVSSRSAKKTSLISTGKSPYSIANSVSVSRERSGLLELLIFGGAATPTSPTQELAIDLLYGPRYLEDERTIPIPEWSVRNPKYIRHWQLGPPLVGDSPQLSICASATARFREQIHRPTTSRTYHDKKVDKEAYSEWRIGADREVRRMTLDRSSLKRSGRFAIDGIRFAPFWIQGRPSDGLRARGEMLQPLKAYPAFAFSWWGTGGKWGGEYGAVLQFIIELASKYEVYNLPDREPLDENVGVQATALQRHTFDLYFDPDCRTETLLSAALGARDSATGQSVVFSMMRACPRLVAFADELILLVVQYLILPCISTEMVEFVEKYEKTVNG